MATACSRLRVEKAARADEGDRAREMILGVKSLREPVHFHPVAKIEGLLRLTLVRSDSGALLEKTGAGDVGETAREIESAEPRFGFVPSTEVVFGLGQIDVTEDEPQSIQRLLFKLAGKPDAECGLVRTSGNERADRRVQLPACDILLAEPPPDQRLRAVHVTAVDTG